MQAAVAKWIEHCNLNRKENERIGFEPALAPQAKTIKVTQFLPSFYRRIYARRCGLGHGQDVRQRLLSNHHFEVRGPQLVIQEHVQTEAAPGQVAGGRRQLDQQQRRHVLQLPVLGRQHGQAAEEEDFHRDHSTCLAFSFLLRFCVHPIF